MSNIFLSACDCPPVCQDCSITPAPLIAGFCGSPSSNDCPSTYSVAVAISSVAVSQPCYDGSYNYTVEDLITYPAFTQTVTVSNSSESNKCQYSGSGSNSAVTIEAYDCLGSVTETYVRQWLDVSFHAAILKTNAYSAIGIATPCEDASEYCIGLCVEVVRNLSNYHGTATPNLIYGACFNLFEISTCDEEAPCYDWVEGTPDFIDSHYAQDLSDNGQCSTGSPKIGCDFCGEAGDPIYGALWDSVSPNELTSGACTSGGKITSVNIS